GWLVRNIWSAARPALGLLSATLISRSKLRVPTGPVVTSRMPLFVGPPCEGKLARRASLTMLAWMSVVRKITFLSLFFSNVTGADGRAARLRAAERALVEEEQLEVLAPSEGAIDPVLR